MTSKALFILRVECVKSLAYRRNKLSRTEKTHSFWIHHYLLPVLVLKGKVKAFVECRLLNWTLQLQHCSHLILGLPHLDTTAVYFWKFGIRWLQSLHSLHLLSSSQTRFGEHLQCPPALKEEQCSFWLLSLLLLFSNYSLSALNTFILTAYKSTFPF